MTREELISDIEKSMQETKTSVAFTVDKAVTGQFKVKFVSNSKGKKVTDYMKEFLGYTFIVNSRTPETYLVKSKEGEEESKDEIIKNLKLKVEELENKIIELTPKEEEKEEEVKPEITDVE